ncbi:Gpi16 subunit, GPI transamidase component-domain-containing protein [Phellopilus nigrolimitatus]|nr:Gpi16 subunit, GPI transamidase component-domain-containing protein [Phellopilus nigrolimitatus]
MDDSESVRLVARGLLVIIGALPSKRFCFRHQEIPNYKCDAFVDFNLCFRKSLPATSTGTLILVKNPSANFRFPSVDDRWKGLRNALSGLFCASIGSLDELRTTSPAYALSPEGMLPRLSPNETHRLRHASLPSEHVCTENLTPFLKLLPCKSSAGIAMFLNPHRLDDVDWHDMWIHVTWSEKSAVTLQLSFQVVLDPVRLSTLKTRDFSLRLLFDRTITMAYPVATDSKIDVTLPQDLMYSITPEPSILHGQVGIFDVTAVRDQPLDIIHYPKEDSFSYPLDVTKSPLSDFEAIHT